MKKLLLAGASALAISALSTAGGAFAASQYFSGEVTALESHYQAKAAQDKTAPAHGMMQTYLTQKYPQLKAYAAQVYKADYQKWYHNQATLSPAEQAKVDKAYKHAQHELKTYIDNLFKQP